MSLWEYLGIDPEDPVEKWAFCEHLGKGCRCPGIARCRVSAEDEANLWMMQQLCAKCWEDALNKGEVTIKCAE